MCKYFDFFEEISADNGEFARCFIQHSKDAPQQLALYNAASDWLTDRSSNLIGYYIATSKYRRGNHVKLYGRLHDELSATKVFSA